jgi:hypothetical protein
VTRVLYAVRCRFTDPDQENAWNEWYSDHVDVLLRVPGFNAAQRFRSATTVDDRPYLAMYDVDGPGVFGSEPYQAIWGFDRWRPLIDSWARDLFALSDDGAIEFATPRGSTLWAAFVGGADGVALLERATPPIAVARSCGLDRSCAGLVWSVGGSSGSLNSVGGAIVAQAVYEPVTEFRRSGG